MSRRPQLPLEEMTLRQLRLVAQQYQISRYSRMTKSELLESIQDAMRVAEAKQSMGRNPMEAQEQVESTKFRVGLGEPIVELDDVDEDLGDLPGGYGESRIVLLPRDPQWGYAYWDISNEHKDHLRWQGGRQLVLRLYDVTEVYFDGFNAHNMNEYPCDEVAREWYIPIPISDRTYVIDIGYTTEGGGFLILSRSASVQIPPVYPSDWVDDRFLTIPFDADLRGKTFVSLTPPSKQRAAFQGVGFGTAAAPTVTGTHQSLLEYMATQVGVNPGSLFGSQQMVSGVGLVGAVPTSFSGIGLSGIGFMGASELFSVSAAPARARSFWLVADAELIVYGATEPTASVTIAGKPVKLNPDGTFRFQYHFPDGFIGQPIVAVAEDGEQSRSITMNFLRDTPVRNTNTKEEMVLETY
jgi:uncharacterized protein